MRTSTYGPRRERGVNGQIRADRGGGVSPGLHQSAAREGWGHLLDRQAERSRGDGLALAQRGDAPPSLRAAKGGATNVAGLRAPSSSEVRLRLVSRIWYDFML